MIISLKTKGLFFISLLISLSAGILLFHFNSVEAATCPCGAEVPVVSDTACAAACPTAGTGGTTVTLNNPLGSGTQKTNINYLIGRAINGVLGITGSLALAMFIYGGFMWMVAAGNQQRVQKGKDILVWAVIGLVIIFSAYAMVRFLFVNIFGATG